MPPCPHHRRQHIFAGLKVCRDVEDVVIDPAARVADCGLQETIHATPIQHRLVEPKPGDKEAPTGHGTVESEGATKVGGEAGPSSRPTHPTSFPIVSLQQAHLETGRRAEWADRTFMVPQPDFPKALLATLQRTPGVSDAAALRTDEFPTVPKIALIRAEQLRRTGDENVAG